MTEKELFKYLSSHELDIQSARAQFTFAEQVYGSYTRSHRVHGMEFAPVITAFHKDKFFQLVDRGIYDVVAEKVYKNFIEDSKSLDDLIASHRELEYEMDELWEGVRYRLKEAERKVLSECFKRILEIGDKWWQYATIGEDKGGYVEHKLAPQLAKKHGVSVATVVEVIGNLSHPDEMTFFTKERSDFLDLGYQLAVKLDGQELPEDKVLDLVRADDGLMERIESYRREFFWRDTDFYRHVDLTFERVVQELMDEVNKVGRLGIEQELENIRIGGEKIKKSQREARSRFDLDEEDMAVIEFNKKMTLWQDWRKLGMTKYVHYFCSLLDEFSDRLSVAYDDMAYASMDELLTLIEGRSELDIKKIMARKRGVVCAFEKDRQLTVFPRITYEKVIQFIKERGEHEDLQGTVASKGKEGEAIIRGKVAVVHNPAKDEFQHGDILVTSMTRVEFVPLMRKARAIITDEGGITTHAAIVSRELGVPCVIGTKNATHLLKNGDEIEVDLDNGIIRKV